MPSIAKEKYMNVCYLGSTISITLMKFIFFPLVFLSAIAPAGLHFTMDMEKMEALVKLLF